MKTKKSKWKISFLLLVTWLSIIILTIIVNVNYSKMFDEASEMPANIFSSIATVTIIMVFLKWMPIIVKNGERLYPGTTEHNNTKTLYIIIGVLMWIADLMIFRLLKIDFAIANWIAIAMPIFSYLIGIGMVMKKNKMINPILLFILSSVINFTVIDIQTLVKISIKVFESIDLWALFLTAILTTASIAVTGFGIFVMVTIAMDE